MNEQGAQVAIAALADAEQSVTIAAGVIHADSLVVALIRTMENARNLLAVKKLGETKRCV